MEQTGTQTRNLDKVRAYYARLDGQSEDLFVLFTEDFEFYYPKFGRGFGSADFASCAASLFEAFPTLRHDPQNLTLYPSGPDIVVAEGTTSGLDIEGRTWQGGETAGGRFCSVFKLDPEGLIERMYIFTDPDYTSQDETRFRWGRRRKW